MTSYVTTRNAARAALIVSGLWALAAIPMAQAQVVADDVVCAGCVGKGDIADKAVTARKIKSNSIFSPKIVDRSIKGVDIGLGEVELANLSPALQAKLALLDALLAVVVVEDVGTDLNGDGLIEDVPVDLDGDGVADADSEFLPTVRFEGVNLQVVNDDESQETDSLNALGNLIVGYNEARTGAVGDPVCSDGAFADITNCLANGHVWALSHKSGSHNLVVGPENAYSRAGGVVFGGANVVNRAFASVTGGVRNVASGQGASVSGGQDNTASGDLASVSAGDSNRATALSSGVSGGVRNTANGEGVSIVGGNDIFATPACLWGGEGQILGNGSC